MAKKNMRGSDDVDGTVDMSPMIDCCFLLLIFFVVNATAITVSKDLNVRMPSAVACSDMKDAKGCIVVNIFKDLDKFTDERAKEKFLENYSPGTLWSAGEKGYTEDQIGEVTEYIKTQKKQIETRPDIQPEQIRIYLRGDSDAPWERTAAVIRCAAEAGISNIVFATLPSR